MRRGKLIEQHISDLVWVAHLLDYTGLLLIHCCEKSFQIHFRKGELVHQRNSDNPIDILEKIVNSGTGEFTFYDQDTSSEAEDLIPITTEYHEWLITQSKKAAGYPRVFYSNEIMGSRISPVKLTRIPENISPSTLRLYELCTDIPTIAYLNETFTISPKTILEVAFEGIEFGVLNLLNSDGKQIPKSHISSYIEPTSYQLTYSCKLLVNESLTAKRGRVHISPEKQKIMNNFQGDASVKARINQGYFDVDIYKIKSNEVMVTSNDIQSFGLKKDEDNEIILVKGA